MKLLIPLTLLIPLLAPAGAFANKAQDRLKEATVVFQDIMKAPDKGIPQDLLEGAHCIVIVPSVKQGAFIVGAKYGVGYALCRQPGGGWGAPASVRIEGGSVGFQIGGSSTDLIMLVMNERGKTKLLQSKFTLGADASAAAGPVGRTTSAMTDAQMGAAILTWSRTQGLFAGISLEGATLRNDLDSNAQLYGRKIDNKAVLNGEVQPPPSADQLIAMLDKYSFHERGSSADRSAPAKK